MTDAREIIESALRELLKKSRHKQPWGAAIISDLEVAGFRILRPDEVDQVTVEKCASHLEGRGTVFMRDAAATIRALGRKA